MEKTNWYQEEMPSAYGEAQSRRDMSKDANLQSCKQHNED